MPWNYPKKLRSSHAGAGLTWGSVIVAAGAFFFVPTCWADGPFFVTYTSHMEERGALEVGFKNVTGKPGQGNAFLGSALEFEYGVTSWWTTEFYLDRWADDSEPEHAVYRLSLGSAVATVFAGALD